MRPRGFDRPIYRTRGRETEPIKGSLPRFALPGYRPPRSPQPSKAELRRAAETALAEWRARRERRS